jgi:hypothetical protein
MYSKTHGKIHQQRAMRLDTLVTVTQLRSEDWLRTNANQNIRGSSKGILLNEACCTGRSPREFPALNVVLDDLPTSIDTVVSLGDFVGVMGFP